MNTQQKLYFIGNAHLDPVWLWRWQEGYAEIKATFRSALDRIEEFPEFIFTCACAAYYEWVEHNAPDMFEEIKLRVAEGRWVIVGGWWIQPDCNIPSGESFARQGLYSQRYFHEKFGKMATVGYNVDSFGHNGMLPQILKKSGMDSYVFMRPDPNENNRIPSLFQWESEDGSRVLTFKIPFGYASWGWHGTMAVEAEGDYLKQKTISTLELAEALKIDMMNFFGVGNHGGGPTIANLNKIREMRREWGEDRLFISSPDRYFEEVGKNSDIAVFKDDLQHTASGCYSAHSETKALNRKSENRLLAAEKCAALSHLLLGVPSSQAEIRKAWKNVMFNQFHDIICGVSIKGAYEDSREVYGEALNIGAKVLNSALQGISWSIDTMGEELFAWDKQDDSRIWEKDNKGVPLVVFNPLSWPVSVPIEVNKTVRKVIDQSGASLRIQQVRGFHTQEQFDKWNTVFIGSLPAMGYAVFWIYRANELPMIRMETPVRQATPLLENELMRIEFDPDTGYIASMYDKQHQVNLLTAPGAVPLVMDETHCDTWAHGIFEFRDQVGVFSDAVVELVENGPVRSTIRVVSQYLSSKLQQEFTLYAHSSDLEVKVKLDWREQQRMLKLSFPVNVADPKATYEIPYGHIERPVNGEEEPGQQWVDVSGSVAGREGFSYGIALLNDSKYSFDVLDNDLRMTVVRSPIFADHGDPLDSFCEFMDQGVQEFRYTLSPHVGNWTGTQVVRKAYQLNNPPVQVIETYHKGSLPQRFEGIRISEDNVIATVFKRAEDEGGYILRCYEAEGRTSRTTIELPGLDRAWNAEFGRCEIKTFFIPDAPGAMVIEQNLIEHG